MESPEIAPHQWGHLIFDTTAKLIHWEKKINSLEEGQTFQQMVLEKLDIYRSKKKKNFNLNFELVINSKK